MREDRRPRRIGDPRLLEPPARRARDLRVLEPLQSPHARADARIGLAVDEAVAGDHELERAQARRAEVGVVGLGQLGLAQREPDVAAQLRRGAEPVLVRRRPCVRGAGCPRSGVLGGGRRGENEEGEQGDDDARHARGLPPPRAAQTRRMLAASDQGGEMLRRASCLAVLVLVAIPAAASAKGPRMYTVSPVRDIIDRSALTVSGAAIIEVDHAEVVVTASKRTVKRLRRKGFTVQRMHPLRQLKAQARPRPRGRLPAGRRQRTTTTPRWTRRSRARRPRSRHRPALQHRHLVRGPHDLGGQDLRQRRAPTRTSRRCCSPPPARARAPDGRDGAVPAARAHDQVRDRPADHEPRQQPRDVHRLQRQPGRRRVRHRHRQLPVVAQEPPAQRGSSAVGTDLNRNWSYQWGCCGGSSGTFSSETYRGASAFSAPETQRVRDFVNSRVVGGAQQIKAHIDFHTYSELVLWPYGYTTANTAPGADRRRPGDALHARQPDGGDQRLHARAGQRPVHRRRHDQRLGVGRAPASRRTRSRCTRARRTRASIRPTR